MYRALRATRLVAEYLHNLHAAASIIGCVMEIGDAVIDTKLDKVSLENLISKEKRFLINEVNHERIRLTQFWKDNPENQVD